MTGSGDFRAAFGTDAFVGAYTEILVPRLFLPWAVDLVDDLGPERGTTAVDVACGPGTVTRVLAERIGPGGRVVGLDLSPAMLERARAVGTAPDAAPVEWRVSPAEALEVEDAAADVLTCQQGLQFFADRARAVAEWRRVTRPGGRLAASCWCSLEECRPYADMGRALMPTLGEEAVDRLRMPFHFGDGETIARLLTDAGFAGVRSEVRRRPLVLEGGVDMVWAAIGATPLAPALDGVDAGEVEACRRRLGESLADITDAQGVVHGAFTSVVVFARGG